MPEHGTQHPAVFLLRLLPTDQPPDRQRSQVTDPFVIVVLVTVDEAFVVDTGMHWIGSCTSAPPTPAAAACAAAATDNKVLLLL
jgi:hypothetical protein